MNPNMRIVFLVENKRGNNNGSGRRKPERQEGRDGEHALPALFLFPAHGSCDAGVGEKGQRLGFSRPGTLSSSRSSSNSREPCEDDAETVAAGDLERKNKAGK